MLNLERKIGFLIHQTTLSWIIFNEVLFIDFAFDWVGCTKICFTFSVVSTIPKIVCETLAALGLQEEIPSWKIMDNKGKITVVLHWEKEHPPGQPPNLQVYTIISHHFTCNIFRLKLYFWFCRFEWYTIVVND